MKLSEANIIVNMVNQITKSYSAELIKHDLVTTIDYAVEIKSLVGTKDCFHGIGMVKSLPQYNDSFVKIKDGEPILVII